MPIRDTGAQLAIEKTPAQYGLPYIQEKYTEFRNRFFGGDSGPLPERMDIRFNNRSRALGTCQLSITRKRNGGFGRTVTDEWLNSCVIYLSNAYDFSPKLLDEVLIHEMIHAWLAYKSTAGIHEGHGPNFQAKCNEINAASGYHVTIACDQELTPSQGKLNSLARDNSVILVTPFKAGQYIVSRCSRANAAWFARGLHDWLKADPRGFECHDLSFKNSVKLRKTRVGGTSMSRGRIDDMVASGVLREVEIPKSDMSENAFLAWPVEGGKIDYALVNNRYVTMNVTKICIMCRMRGLIPNVFNYAPTGEFDGWPSRPNTDSLYTAQTDRSTIDRWVSEGKLVPVDPLPGTSAINEAWEMRPRLSISPLVDWLVDNAGLPRNGADNYVRACRNDPSVMAAIRGSRRARFLVAKRVGDALGIPVFSEAEGLDEIADAARVNSMSPRDEAAGVAGEALFEVVRYRKGHKNSKGEAAPWCIVSCHDGHVISSHTSKKKAEKHLRQMEYYKHVKNEAADEYESPVVEALMGAFGALMESVKPGPATMKTIMDIVPAPEDGWDGPAFNSEGKELVSERSGNRFTWLTALEAGVKNEFYHGSGIAPKFEPGLARIAFGELGYWPAAVEDWRTQRQQMRSRDISLLKSIAAEISSPAHRAEYTSDLNGSSFEELRELFRSTNVDDETDSGREFGDAKYDVVHIRNFSESSRYSDYVPWCICSSRSYWNQYSHKGVNKCYFLLEKGYQDIPERAGENAPLDKYGLSMIGLFVSPDGKLAYCCCRWNHGYGATDHMLSKPEISRLIGQDFDSACPPFTRDELSNGSTDAITAELLCAKMARYKARRITDSDQLEKIIQADFGDEVEFEDLGWKNESWTGYKLLSGDQGNLLFTPDFSPVVDYFVESLEIQDGNLLVLSSSITFNSDNDYYDYADECSLILYHRKYGAYDLAADTGISNDVYTKKVGDGDLYLVSDEVNDGRYYLINCNGWTVEFEASEVSTVGNMFVLDESMRPGDEIDDGQLYDYVFRVYWMDENEQLHRASPGEQGGCTFNACSIGYNSNSLVYIIDEQAVLLTPTGATTPPRMVKIPGKYVRIGSNGVKGVTLGDEAGNYTMFDLNGKKLLSVPGCNVYSFVGESNLILAGDDENASRALYDTDGRCIVPKRPGWTIKLVSYTDYRHIGILNDAGISICDISSGKPRNMFRGTFKPGSLCGGYFKNGKCLVVVRGEDKMLHVVGPDMKDTIRPYSIDIDVDYITRGNVITRKEDGKTKYNVLTEEYEEILPEDADWVSNYIDPDTRDWYLADGFIVGYDNGLKMLVHRGDKTRASICGPFTNIEVAGDVEENGERKFLLKCTRPGGNDEYYVSDDKNDAWIQKN